MSRNEISVISVQVVQCEEEREKTEKTESKLVPKVDYKSLSISLFGIIAFCVLFIIPWTTIPRSNSIIHQSHWMEAILPATTVFFVVAGVMYLSLTTYFKEEALETKSIYTKVYFMYLITFILLYISSYLLWSIYLQFNHPLPYLALLIMPVHMICAAGIRFILPPHLLAKQDIQHKLHVFILFYLWQQLSIILREILSFLFANPPFGAQFLVPLMVAAARELDKRIKSKLVRKMMWVQDEAASVLIALNVSTRFSFFIAVRLVDAELFTILCSVAIDFILHSKMTYQIIKECKKITISGLKIINTERNRGITMLVLAELVEGLTPLIYGITMAMAYYGPNSRLFSNVKNNYWSEEIKNIGYLFGTMSTLSSVDLLSVLINSFCLFKALRVNLLSEFCRVLKEYRHFVAVNIAQMSLLYFVAIDVNFGLDQTESFMWKSNEGWIHLVNNSIDLRGDEKNELIATTKFL